MRRIYLSIILIGFTTLVKAQTYTVTDLEQQFLEKNYVLIAGKYNIAKADAEIVQEKLWPNPTLSISEVNLWKTYQIEEQPFLFGNYGNNQQISIELEQLVETAGKRKKRVAIKQLEKNSAVFDFEELMRGLKKELRQNYYSLNRIQTQEILLNSIVDLFTQMNSQYERQAALKNIPTAEFYRIQTELIGLQKEKIELEKEKTESLNKIRLLTQNASLDLSDIRFSDIPFVSKEIPLNIKDQAKENNIGLQRQLNETGIAQNQLQLEKALRVPDLTFQVNYDRGGNIMRDFVGVGVSIDLPVFNTNKGAIRAAKHNIDQHLTQQQVLETELSTTVNVLQEQLQLMDQSLKNWSNIKTDEQQQMIENYKKHLQNKQITLIEFIDFTQAYREAQQAYLELLENYHHTVEELQYITGKDF
ncbi:MAG: TolC family protein [Myroides sp.]